MQQDKKNADSIPTVEIYTDGACSGNPGPGGWGALLIFNDIEKKISGHEFDTTNNRMEMMGAISALKILKKSCNIKLYTDSKYLQQGITEWIHSWIRNNWIKKDKKPVKNADLWQELLAECKKHEINWQWVKGHANNIGNNIADSLAVSAKELAIKKEKND